MRYYVAADVHGFFSELRAALEEQGFFTDPQPHKLILCGDLFDRGPEAKQLQAFVLELLEKDRIILIRGNHEDLLMDYLHSLPWSKRTELHHHSNGTVDTVCQLTDTPEALLPAARETLARKMLHGPLVREILPAMADYFETDRHIFVHGWIPCTVLPRFRQGPEYIFQENWRHATPEQWKRARWINGMEAAHFGITEPGKTIVCGHWHCSFGHANYEGTCPEFGEGADFSPFRAPGILALDACTVRSRKVNCVVIDD